MTTKAESMLIGISEIAAAAEVGSSAVGNWRKRHPDFPTPKMQGPAGALFDLREVERGLVENGKIDGPVPRQHLLWRIVERLRSSWSLCQLTSFLGAGFVYLEACDRSGRTTSSGKPKAVPIKQRWEALRELPDEALGDALIQAGLEIERRNTALDGLIAPGMTQSPAPEPALVRVAFNAIEEAVRDGSTRAGLFEEVPEIKLYLSIEKPGTTWGKAPA